jgi:hypothetical protein
LVIALLLLAAVGATHAAPASASDRVLAPASLGQLTGEADAVFIGTVSSRSSRRLATGVIVSDVAFSDVEHLHDGDAAAPTVLMVLGGTVGEETLSVAGFPEFAIGHRYVVFARGNGTTILPLAGGVHGLFRVRRDPDTGRETVRDFRGRALTRPELPGGMVEGSAAAVEVELRAFADAVAATLALRRRQHP